MGTAKSTTDVMAGAEANVMTDVKANSYATKKNSKTDTKAKLHGQAMAYSTADDDTKAWPAPRPTWTPGPTPCPAGANSKYDGKPDAKAKVLD